MKHDAIFLTENKESPSLTVSKCSVMIFYLLLNREVKCSKGCTAELNQLPFKASVALNRFPKPENSTCGDKFHATLGLKDKAAVLLRDISHVMISSPGIQFKQRNLVIHFLELR